jgi:outer membrane receptor protein involved in Fe transport
MHKKNIPFRLSLGAAAIAAALSANAQGAQLQQATSPADGQTSGADLKTQKVEVRASAGAYDPRRDDTATRIVVGRDEIAKYGDTNVLEVLKRVPGVTVSGGAGRGSEVRMRGLGDGYTQVLINGERAPAGFALESLAPDVIERIEVLRAATAEFSTQAIAGTINIVLRKVIKRGQRELKLGVRHGEVFSGPSANLQLSDSAGQLNYSLAANLIRDRVTRESPGWQAGLDGSGRKFMERDIARAETGKWSALNLSPRLTWTRANGDTLTSQSFVNLNRFSTRVHSLAVASLGSAPQYPDLGTAARIDNDLFRTDLSWSRKLASEGQLDLKMGAVAGRRDDKRRWLAHDPTGARTLDSLVDTPASNRGVNSTGKYSTPLLGAHSLQAGWDVGVETRDESRVQRDVLPDFYRDERFEARIARVALYVQDEWNLTPDWSLHLGGRWESIRSRSADNTFAPTRSRSALFSPVLQTLWKVPGTQGSQLRVALTRTYKAPNLSALIPRGRTSVNNSPYEPDTRGNPNLRPEQASGFDASYEHHLGEGVLLSVSTSMRRIRDYTLWEVALEDGRWVNSPRNEGYATTRGMELEAKFPLQLVLANAPAVDLRASVSRNWSSVDAVPGPNNRLADQTPLSANIGFDYKNGALTTGASFAYRDDREARFTRKHWAYLHMPQSLDAYALWKLNPKMQLRLAASNLLKDDERSGTRYSDEDGSVLLNRVTWRTGVDLRATLEMNF